MRKVFLAVAIILIVTLSCFAQEAPCWVYFVKNATAEPGQISGQTETNDIIAVNPVTPQYEPTSSELSRWKIKKSSMTPEERKMLTEGVTKTLRIKQLHIIPKAEYSKFVDEKAEWGRNTVILSHADVGESRIIEIESDMDFNIIARKYQIKEGVLSDVQKEEIDKTVILNNLAVKSLPIFTNIDP